MKIRPQNLDLTQTCKAILEVSRIVPSNCGRKSKHKLNTCIMFGPKSSVLTVVKRATEVRSNLYSKSYCTAWSFYAVLYVYMFNKETTIKAKLANMNVKVW